MWSLKGYNLGVDEFFSSMTTNRNWRYFILVGFLVLGGFGILELGRISFSGLNRFDYWFQKYRVGTLLGGESCWGILFQSLEK